MQLLKTLFPTQDTQDGKLISLTWEPECVDPVHQSTSLKLTSWICFSWWMQVGFPWISMNFHFHSKIASFVFNSPYLYPFVLIVPSIRGPIIPIRINFQLVLSLPSRKNAQTRSIRYLRRFPGPEQHPQASWLTKPLQEPRRLRISMARVYNCTKLLMLFTKSFQPRPKQQPLSCFQGKIRWNRPKSQCHPSSNTKRM